MKAEDEKQKKKIEKCTKKNKKTPQKNERRFPRCSNKRF